MTKQFPYYLLLRTRISPQATSNEPIAQAMAASSSFWKSEARFIAPVKVSIAQARTSRPVKETNPPKAIFNL
jgi:hypothetical protein